MSIIDTARLFTYRLLARLYLEEVDGEMLGYLRELPGLAGYVPASQSNPDAWLTDLKVEYQWLFGMNVYPYESVYLDDEVMLNTAATQRVVAFYRECGFAPASDLRVGAPDHVGVEMTLMAKLVEAGRQAEQSRLLHQHLSAWGPIVAQTAARVTEQPFYRALAELTIEFLLSDLENVPAPTPTPGTELTPLQPMHADPDLENDNTDEGPGLDAIVDQMLTPSQVGVFLSRVDILRLAQSLDLPAGILERSLMLKNLFRAAGQYELVLELLDAITDVIGQADEQYAVWADTYSAWSRQAGAWRARTEAGLALLNEMRTARWSST